jgi:hypothetical protein
MLLTVICRTPAITSLLREFWSVALYDRHTQSWDDSEPLVIPVTFNEDAFTIATRFASPEGRVTHFFEMNSALMSDEIPGGLCGP